MSHRPERVPGSQTALRRQQRRADGSWIAGKVAAIERIRYDSTCGPFMRDDAGFDDAEYRGRSERDWALELASDALDQQRLRR